MISELKREEYQRVRPLFGPLTYHLTSAAVLGGSSLGRVFVDDPLKPRTAFMLSPEGCYLAGDTDNDLFNQALNKAIFAERRLGQAVRALCFVFHPEGWRERLATVLAPRSPIEMRRRHYVCRALRYDWRAHASGEYTVLRIDDEFLNRPGLTIPNHLTGWVASDWGSTGGFLRGGFGFATVSADRVVCWSLTDCVSSDPNGRGACEIGIRTAPDQRRRGLATITAAATVEYALAHGFSMVGWHCPEDNLGSIGTAEKVGFERERDYTMVYAFVDEAEHLSHAVS